jgi:hypothetical protein
MKKYSNIIVATLLISVIFILTQSCEKEKEGGETKISSNGGNESHNMGRNCMDCHTGWFIVAGTVYASNKSSTYPNATVKLYTGPNGTGTLKYTIQVDAKGNFFTTEATNFGTGLYPSVQGNAAATFMQSVITTGQCNSCHNISTDKIWTN